MKGVKKVTVTQVRIFPHDYVPYAFLLRKDFIKHMEKKYGFQKTEMPFEYSMEGAPKILGFVSGIFRYEKTKRAAINKIVFENRRVILVISATSEITNKAFGSISREIKKFDPEKTFRSSDAVYLGEETTCTASLSIDYMKIFSANMVDFIDKKFSPKIEHPYLSIKPKSMSFVVEFEPNKELYEQHKITLSPKTLTIEPADKVPIDKNIFNTGSPFNSNRHFALLEEFEQAFTK